ncbi:MAG: hypothetical protein AAB692_01205 [Patescibacteria group bacterium]
MPTRRTWKTACFSYKDVEELKDLGDAFCRLGHGGDPRLIAVLERAFVMLEERLTADDAAGKIRRTIIEEFNDAIGHDVDFVEDRLVDTCLDLGRCAAGLAACDRLERIGERDASDILHDRAEFLARLGPGEEAERLLLGALSRNPEDVWVYIALGDLTFSYEPQKEHRDLVRAETWFYRAYDRGLADEKNRGGRILLERLRQACIERLRRERETRLLGALGRWSVGGRETLDDLREDVRHSGIRSALFHHVAAEFQRLALRRPAQGDLKTALRMLTEAFDIMPQDVFDGYSVFETNEFFPTGENESRIRTEASYVLKRGIGSFAGPDEDPRSIARMATLQGEFFDGRDALTGKERRRVIEDERKKTRKSFEDGKLVWTGFLKYRPVIQDLFSAEDFSFPKTERSRKSASGLRPRQTGKSGGKKYSS